MISLSRQALTGAVLSLATLSASSQDVPKGKHLKNDQLLLDAATQNGFGSTKPFHVKARFDLADETGKHAGVFEEWWWGPQRYKATFSDDKLKQTDVASQAGLFRAGDQRWMTRQESLVQALLVDPLSVHPYDPKRNDLIDEPRAIGATKMRCVFLLRKPEIDERAGANLQTDLNSTPSYCFEPESSILRYGSGGYGAEVLLMNEIVRFEGRNIAKDIHVLSGGKESVSVRVLELGAVPAADAPEPVAEQGSIGPLGGRIVLPDDRLTLVSKLNIDPTDIRDLMEAKFSLKLVIGKDGHVLEATAASGPPSVTNKAIKIARKMVFKPFLILGSPVEVETIYSLHPSAGSQPGAPDAGRGRR